MIMMPIKIQCGCGQRYAFDVEPVQGRIPHAVACPVCGADGTAAANEIIAQSMPVEVAALSAPVRAAAVAVVPSVRVSAAPSGPRSATLLLGQRNRSQAQHEARAKILWGDAPKEVVKFLMSQGMALPEASAMVDELFQERAATIRGNGIVKIVIGSALICLPIAAWFIFNRLGFIELKFFAVTILAGFYGVWLIIKGTTMFFAPKSEPGDVAAQ